VGILVFSAVFLFFRHRTLHLANSLATTNAASSNGETAASSSSEKSLQLTAKSGPSIIYSRPAVVHIASNMAFIDVLSLMLSFEFLISLRSLLPRNIVPEVEKSIEEAEKVVQRAEATNIYVNEDRTNLAILRNRFVRMRTESHHSPGLFQQLYLTFFRGLSLRLTGLGSQVNAIRRRLELAEAEQDERQLALLTNTNGQSTTTTALPVSAGDAIIPMTNATDWVYSPQAVRRRAYH
jgi:hypothetical protein